MNAYSQGSAKQAPEFIEMSRSFLKVVTWIRATAMMYVTMSALAFGEDTAHWRKLLSNHCGACHVSDKRKGDFDLASLDLPIAHSVHLWEDVVRLVKLGEMPPPKDRLLSEKEKSALATGIEDEILTPFYVAAKAPSPSTSRRMTAREFELAIFDLLGASIDVSSIFTSDSTGGSGGYSNQGDSLFFPPMLLTGLLDPVMTAVDHAKPEKLPIVTVDESKAKSESAKSALRRKAAETFLEEFLTRAWRRPVRKPDLSPYLKVYERASKKTGATHVSSVKSAIAASLMSPNFLFIIERTKKQGGEQIDDYELASRMSFFLWSRIPDKELLEAAKSGTLGDRAEISRQIRRMLADDRSIEMFRQFIPQWLGIHELRNGIGPDKIFSPDYDEELREAMIEEAVLTARGIARDRKSLLDFIDADYVWADKRLCDLYGIRWNGNQGYSRYPVDRNRRGGVIGMAGVLAVTSRPTRTSPVLRGKWILDNLLGAPPPPPPPNVPPLEEPTENGAKGNPRSIRDLLNEHRARPDCNGCHQRIDPIGFGLENYDLLGRWRNRDISGKELDVNGVTPSGEAFSGPGELKKIIMARKREFVQYFCEQMAMYALGRALRPSDIIPIKEIVEQLSTEEYRLSDLIERFCVSSLFTVAR